MRTEDYAGMDLDDIEHTLQVDKLCQRFDTSITKGLPSEFVEINRQKYGWNIISSPIQPSKFFKLSKHLFQGVSSLMVSGAIVCMMSFVADAIGDVESKVDMENLFLGLALVIFITIIATFSYVKEQIAKNILDKGISLVPRNARVVRNGQRIIVNVDDIVVGDLIEIKSGDQVPADIRIVESVGFKVDTALLTGISEPKIIKTESTHPNPLLTQNMIYTSTYGVEGFCRGIVVRTGDNTMLGRITALSSQVKEKQSPLSNDVTKLISIFTSVGIVLAVVCWVAAIRLDYSWSNTTVFFVSVCVAVVPESLLAAIPVCHYVAAQRLMQICCITKQFDAIENLGATSVLCIDKTGTVTENKPAVVSAWAGSFVDVGKIPIDATTGKRKLLPTLSTFSTLLPSLLPTLLPTISPMDDLLTCILLTTNATVTKLEDGSYDVKDGSPVDIALKSFALSFEETRNIIPETKLYEVLFNYRTFYQLSIFLDQTTRTDKCRIVMRGAPERVFRCCSTLLVEGKEKKITAEYSEMFEAALEEIAATQARVIGFCEKVIPYSKDMSFSEDSTNYSSEHRFLGLASISDVPLADAKVSIAKIRSASIKVIMLTGDHPTTALHIAKSIGIITEENSTDDQKKSCMVTGFEFEELFTTGRLASILQDFDELVFARVSPAQKAIVVEQLQQQGELVTMVGDGMNDCAAMKAADTSVAVGEVCSEAAKSICDIVVLGNNLGPIVSGIEEGRLVFENMKKCFAFTISSNIPEVLPFFLFLFLGIPLPINPISIIVLTIGIDMLPAIALAYEPPEWDLMKDPLHKSLKEHKLFSGRLLERAYARIGIAQFATGMFAYSFVMVENGFHLEQLLFISQRWYSKRVVTDSHGQEWTYDQRQHLEDVAQTVYFYAVALVQLAHLLGCKMRRESLFRHGFKNWRLIVALVVPLVLITVIVKTQVLHFIETSRIESIPAFQLLPAIPFAVFIFIYDEFRRFLIRIFPESWIGKKLNF